jgi:hypothetical protein
MANIILDHRASRAARGWQLEASVFQGVYAPRATLFGHHDITVIFAGYHTPKPKNGLGDYRTIGRVGLHSSETILAGSNDAGAGDDDDK